MELQSDTQHGFRKGRSTMTQLLTHVDIILSELCGDQEVDAIYLDFIRVLHVWDILIIDQFRSGREREIGRERESGRVREREIDRQTNYHVSPAQLQTDPDLVTSSGERILVTKSGWALNRGQITLISHIGGNLLCH
eukprot:sb/3474521/